MSKPLAALVALAAFTLADLPAFAKPAPGHADVGRIETYLNAMKTMTSDFSQIAPDGSLSSGRFFLSRPGKFRWSYDPPVPVLIIGNNNTLSYFDLELDEVSHVSMDENLAGLLARKEIKFFDADIDVLDFKKEASVLRLTVAQKGKVDEGKLTLVLDDAPLTLRKLEVTDATGEVTSISLNNVKYGMNLDGKLFEEDMRPAYPVKKRN